MMYHYQGQFKLSLFVCVCVYSVVYVVQKYQIRGLHVPGKYYIYIYLSFSLYV